MFVSFDVGHKLQNERLHTIKNNFVYIRFPYEQLTQEREYTINMVVTGLG